MVYSNCQCLSAFCWSLTYCSFYLKYISVWPVVWPTAGNELSPWLFTYSPSRRDIMVVLCPGFQLAAVKKGRFLYVFDEAGSQPAP